MKHGSYNKDIQEIKLEEYTGIVGSEIAEAGQYGLSIIPALENSYQYNCEAITNTKTGEAQ